MSALEMTHYKALYKSTDTLLYYYKPWPFVVVTVLLCCVFVMSDISLLACLTAFTQ